MHKHEGGQEKKKTQLSAYNLKKEKSPFHYVLNCIKVSTIAVRYVVLSHLSVRW